MSIIYKTQKEIDSIKESAEILGKVHGEIAKNIKVGTKTKDLDTLAEKFIKDHGALPSFLNYNGFPFSLCISVNEVVVHGLPSDYELKDGDIISVDCGVFYKGYHADSAYTYPVGNVKPEVLKLLKATKESLYKGIEQVKPNGRLGDVGSAIQKHVEQFGYSVVRELVGHGIGQDLHEEPIVQNYGKRGEGKKLQNGIVIAIEPMINMGKKDIEKMPDDHGIRTVDKKPSAHFEHTVALINNKAEILTTFKYIEEVFPNF
ncbi:MAG: type I methionyl aminopeptidase [Thermoflexibacteraceae bacterium]